MIQVIEVYFKTRFKCRATHSHTVKKDTHTHTHTTKQLETGKRQIHADWWTDQLSPVSAHSCCTQTCLIHF